MKNYNLIKVWSKWVILMAVFTMTTLSCHIDGDNPAVINIVNSFPPPQPISESPSYTKAVEYQQFSTDTKNNSMNGGYNFVFKPTMLPFSLKWNHEKGFYINKYDITNIPTPIGTFGLEYYVSRDLINGHTITNNDYIVSIIDRSKNTKKVYKIEGHKELDVRCNGGETIIKARPGIVEVDVTGTVSTEINFYSKTTIAMVNPTNQTISYTYKETATWGVQGSTEFNLSIPPNHYYYLPIILMNNDNDAKMRRTVTITEDKQHNDEISTYTRIVGLGEVCHFYLDENGKARIKKGT